MKTDTTSARIKQVRIEAGLSQQALADGINALGERKISRVAVTQWETKPNIQIEAANLIRAAKVLNVTPEWLQFGTGQRDPLPATLQELSSTSLHAKMVPIFAYEQVGGDMKIDKRNQSYLGIDEELAKVVSPHVFAMMVVGNSMSPVLEPGDYVIIDPEVKPQPGEIVVVKLQKESAVILKKYRPLECSKDGSEIFELIAFNEDWPKIVVDSNNPGQIVGTLVEHRCRRRIRSDHRDPQYAPRSRKLSVKKR